MTASKLTHDEREDLFLNELSADETRALIRYRANQILHVHYPEGVDVLADRAKSLFDAIATSALTVDPDASDRDLFYKSVEIWTTIIQLAVINGRSDLEPMGIALNSGLIALEERKKGFDEPLLRAPRRSRHQRRDAYYVRQLKVLSADACFLLRQHGVRDAASQIAKVINRDGLLPHKRNGKAIVAKSVLNWQRGDRYFRWLFLPEMTNRFSRAKKLWDDGHSFVAQQKALRELSKRLKEMRRAWMET
jgi:hypothetical protein